MPPATLAPAGATGAGRNRRTNQSILRPDRPASVSDEKQDPVVVAMGEAGDKTSGNDERRRFDIGGQNGSPLPEVDRVEGVWGGVVGGAAGGGLTAAAAGGVDVRGDEVKEVDDDGVDEGGGRVHLFRVKSYTAPVWCEVCRRMLFGVREPRRSVIVCAFVIHQLMDQSSR